MTRKQTLKLAGITFLLFLVTLAIFFPGFISEDSVSQLTEARNGLFTDGNPPIMAFIWRQIDHIYPGQTGMLILQLLVYWVGLFFITLAADMNFKHGSIFLFCVGMFPGTLGILGTIWKDLLLMTFGVFSIGTGMLAVKKKSIPWLVLSVCSCFLACSFRQNGIFILPPFLFGLFFSFLSKSVVAKRKTMAAIIIAIIGTFIFFTLNSFLTYNVLHAKKSHLWRLLPLYDLTGIYYELGYIPTGATPPFATESFSIEKIHSLYTSRSLMPLVLPLCNPDRTACNPPPVFDITLGDDPQSIESLSRLKSLWAEQITHHPYTYLLHRINVFGQLIGLRGDFWAPVYFEMTKNQLNMYWELTSFQKFFKKLLGRLTEWGFFDIWVFVILNVLVFIFLLRDRDKEMWGIIFGINLSAFFFEWAYFLITPSMDYRYSLWLIVGTLICCALLLHRAWIARS